MARRIPFAWKPQPRQADLLQAAGLLKCLTGGQPERPVANLIGYGGAAYGGKTDGALGLALLAAIAFPGCHIGYFRRTFPELEGEGGAIERSLQIYGEQSSYNQGQHLHTFIGGSRLRFCHAENEKDVMRYRSNQFDILLLDEATSFTWYQIDYLLTRNRSTVAGPWPFAAMFTNPGDIGHVWYRSIFVNGPPNVAKRVELPSGKYDVAIFLPALLEDNQIGVLRDPEYEHRLERRDPQLYQALRWGNWDLFEGQALREWNPRQHLIDPIPLPASWPKWRAVDWGFVHPFCAGWLSRDPVSGRIYVYRELHEKSLTDRVQARLIRDNTPKAERVTTSYADPSMWAKRGSVKDVRQCTADEYAAEGVDLTRGENDRRAGLRKIHRLLGPLPDGKPGLVIFNTCTELARCLPQLIVSKTDPEDVEKVEGDDPYDMLRYGLTDVDVYYDANIPQREREPALADAPMRGMEDL